MKTTRLLPACAVLALAFAAQAGAQTRAEATAKRLYESRTAATDAAAQLQRTFRAGDGEVVRLLDYAGYRSPDIARASTQTLRASASEAAGYMAKAGMNTGAIAAGLARGAQVTGRQALDALVDAGLDGVMTAAVYRSTSASAEDITAFLRARGEPSTKAAQDLVDTHRLDAKTVTRRLMAEYPVIDVGRALIVTFRMDASGIRSFLQDEGVDPPLADATLLDLGFEPEIPKPKVVAHYTTDWRYGASPGARIENPGFVVNRTAVLPAPAADDGVVWFYGNDLDRPELEVWANVEEGTPVQGEIRSIEQVGFQDRVEVLFPNFKGTGMRLSHDGGGLIWRGVRGLGYAPIELTLFEEALEDLSVSATGGSYEIMFGGNRITGPMESVTQTGFEVGITRLVTDGHEVSTQEGLNGGVDVVLSLSFDESGPEFAGEAFGYIPCWRCLTTTVPKADCPTLTASCLLDFLGQAFNNMGECTNLSNWHETEILDTEGVPFQGDLINASLDIAMTIFLGPNGLTAGPSTFDFQSEVTISTPLAEIDEDELDMYISQRVSETLNAAMGGPDLSQALVNGLRQYAGVLGWGRWRSLRRMSDGRLFVAFENP